MEAVLSPRRRTLFAWTPAIVVPSLVLAGVVIAPMAAGAVSLPQQTPAGVVAMMNGSHDLAYTATVSKVANLGIPDIGMGAAFMPDSADSDSADSDSASAGGAPVALGDTAPGALLTTALEVFSGEHTARVAIDPQVGVRVQVFDQLDERNIVVNETEAWLYDSSTNTATRMSVPDEQALADALPDGSEQKLEQRLREFTAQAPAEFSTPAGIAQYIIDELDADSTIAMADNVRVAGRDAYELRVTPDASDTLVDSITLAVDAETGLPLRVVVSAVGQDAPAFSVSLSELDLSTPNPGLFSFTPPPGATVTDAPTFKPSTDRGDNAGDAPTGVSDEAPNMPTVLQSGWATVVEISAESMPDELVASPLLGQFATSVDGGSVVRTALATVFISADGRILVGTVSLGVLQAAAAR